MLCIDVAKQLPAICRGNNKRAAMAINITQHQHDARVANDATNGTDRMCYSVVPLYRDLVCTLLQCICMHALSYYVGICIIYRTEP
jgi:hypothetical protein